MNIKDIHLSQLNPGSRIYLHHGGPRITEPSLRNDSYVAAYAAHGSGFLEFEDGSSISVSEGDVFLINPTIVYRFVPIKGLRRIDVYFCYFGSDIISFDNFRDQFPELLSFFDMDETYMHAIDSHNKEIRDIFIRMIGEYLSNLPGNNTVLHGYLQILLTKIFRNTKTRDFKPIYSQNRTVDEAIRYINRKLYSKISLDEIAKHLKVSPSFVCRQFKKYVGMTTSQFINFLRVEKIKDILKNTDKPVDAIPEMFNCNVEYLKRVFKRETGMTMQEYKDKYNYKYSPSDKNL